MTPIALGHVEAIVRYPVKSMRGEPLDAAELGWHGLEGDRRLALRRLDAGGGFPFLSASKLPELVRYAPQRTGGALPTHVRTPEGRDLPVFGEELAAELSRRCGERVQMMELKHGIFDEACVSILTSETVREVGRLAGLATDARRFRPNILVRSLRGGAFEEDQWVGRVLSFGDGGPEVSVTLRDVRCAMLNLDPDTAAATPEFMKAVVRTHENTAGVYGTVTRIGRIAVGQAVLLR